MRVGLAHRGFRANFRIVGQREVRMIFFYEIPTHFEVSDFFLYLYLNFSLCAHLISVLENLAQQSVKTY